MGRTVQKKFAYIQFAEDTTEIKLPWLVTKLPRVVYHSYIKRKNPFMVGDIDICGLTGYKIILPALEDEVHNSPELVQYILQDTLEILYDYNVAIYVPPKNYPFLLPQNIQVSDGMLVFPFLVWQAYKKAQKLMGVTIARNEAEFMILDGDAYVTRLLIDVLSSEVSYITILTREPDGYARVVDEIYQSAGLNIQVLSYSKQNVGTADVIIKTGGDETDEYRFDHFFKQKSIYFSMSGFTRGLSELIRKREDMFIAHGVELKHNNKYLPPIQTEIMLYLTCERFRKCVDGISCTGVASDVKNTLESLGAVISNFYKKPVNNPAASCGASVYSYAASREV